MQAVDADIERMMHRTWLVDADRDEIGPLSAASEQNMPCGCACALRRRVLCCSEAELSPVAVAAVKDECGHVRRTARLPARPH